MARTITAGTMGVGVVAILAGLVGAYGLRSVLTQQQAPPPAPAAPEVVEVPMASIDLEPGRTIGLGDISLVAMTRKEMQEQFKDSLQRVMLAPEQIMGRIAREKIQQGDPFLTDAFYLEGDAPRISELLKQGYRAVTLEIPGLRSGMVKSKDHVDVVFRASPRRGEEDQLSIPETTVTLLEGVEVIATEYPRILAPSDNREPQILDLRQRSATSGTLPPPTVTLAVTPEGAQVIEAVKGRGELTLVPRSAEEAAITAAKPKSLTLEDVLGIQPPPEPEPTIVFATEIFRRGERQVNLFRDRRSMPQNDQLRDLPTFDPAILAPAEKQPADRPEQQ